MRRRTATEEQQVARSTRHAMRSGTKRKNLSKNNTEEAKGTNRGKGEVPEVADFVHNYNAGNIELHRHDHGRSARFAYEYANVYASSSPGRFVWDANPHPRWRWHEGGVGGSVKFTATCYREDSREILGEFFGTVSRRFRISVVFRISEIGRESLLHRRRKRETIMTSDLADRAITLTFQSNG